MDLGSPSLCFMMVCLLGAAPCSNADILSCPCPEIPQRTLTQPPKRNCFEINDTFRYECIEGYVRKAGTSNRIVCKQVNGDPQWTVPSLQCKPDPKIKTTTQPPKTTVTKGHIHIPYDAVITTTVTAASTSVRMTQSISVSASVTAETDSAEPTSPDLPVLSDHSQDSLTETKATDRTTLTSTTTVSSNKSTANPHLFAPTELRRTTSTLISIVSLVIICALIGIFLCYRRKSKNQRTLEEEQMPMARAP